jgi:predicted nucleotidyltransferase
MSPTFEQDEALAAVFAHYPELAAAWVFGSVARGEARPDSDLDVGLLFRKRGDTALDHYRMLGDLASRLEQVVEGRSIDLVVLEPQGPIFCHRVLSEGRLVYDGDRDRRVDFVSDTISHYLDFQPTWERMAHGRIRAMRAWLESRR